MWLQYLRDLAFPHTPLGTGVTLSVPDVLGSRLTSALPSSSGTALGTSASPAGNGPVAPTWDSLGFAELPPCPSRLSNPSQTWQPSPMPEAKAVSEPSLYSVFFLYVPPVRFRFGDSLLLVTLLMPLRRLISTFIHHFLV